MQRCLLYIVLLLSFRSFAQTKYEYNNVLGDGGMPGKASCMLFSKKGFFYTGTSTGLYLFNGISLKPLTAKTDSVQNITSLFENSKGELWIGCGDGRLFTYISNKVKLWKPQEGSPAKSISAITEDEKGNLWIATRGEGVYTLYQNKLFNINSDDGLSDNYVYDIKSSGMQVIAATDQGISICSFDGVKKKIKNYNTADGLADNIVQCIAEDAKDKNDLWLGFQNGSAGVFDLNTGKCTTVYKGRPAGEPPVNGILPLDHEIWMADDYGVTVLERNNFSSYRSFTLPPLIAIHKDDEANLWLLNAEGIYKTNGEQLRPVLWVSNDESKSIHDLLADDKGCYWVTAKEGVACYTPSAGSYTRSVIKLPLHTGSEVITLYMDVHQKIWAGTMGDGVFVIDALTRSVKHITENGIDKASILSISGNNKNVWVTSLEGVWRTPVSSYSFENFNTASSTGSAYIYYVMEDSKGRVWFATDGKGITMLQNGTYTSFREKEGMAAKVVYSVAEDNKGNIWFNTLNNGVYKYDNHQFKHFGTEQGLPDLTVTAISTDRNGNIFCVSPKGCFLIDAITENIIPVNHPNETGELNPDLNSSFSNGTNTFFQAGNYIYSFMLPSYRAVNTPQTRILNVLLFLDDADMQRSSFNYNENNLSFNFTGFYYSDPSRVSYQYKLEGYNNEWQFTKDGFVNFPKLSPASYTFRVRSSVNGSFEKSNEASWSFTITRPFWKRWWFILLSITAVTAFLILIIKAREKEVQKMQQLQNEKLQSQYETLKSQVNPHFLFNSFNTLLNVIDEDPKKASLYVEHLSDFYRSIVNLREKDLIPLGEELKIIEHYFFIQKKRFGVALQFESTVSEEEKTTYSIPPLTLQLLAENAVKHNAVSKDKPLKLSLHISNGQLVVQNNINEKMVLEKGEGLGLQNIKNRFQLIADKEVTVEKTETNFIVKLPLIKVV